MSIDVILLELDDVVADLASAHASARAVRQAALASARDETDRELASLRAARAFDEALDRVLVLRPGAREAIASYAARARVAVVTRLTRHAAERILARSELEASMRCIVAADDVGAVDGGHARALARLSHTRAVAPDRAVALVADARGLATARAAGVVTVGVGAEARALDADAWVASVDGLPYDALVQLLERSGVRRT